MHPLVPIRLSVVVAWVGWCFGVSPRLVSVSVVPVGSFGVLDRLVGMAYGVVVSTGMIWRLSHWNVFYVFVLLCAPLCYGYAMVSPLRVSSLIKSSYFHSLPESID